MKSFEAIASEAHTAFMAAVRKIAEEIQQVH